ncbi:chromate efflux transporter [Novosphingobium resinovorum]|uniref:chromate efflux transporter n=1 Tax=Novosphingobium resinovorum TaxID=158500 RepID=UPI002ED1DBF6|nr:chromate efflux transporter [Novosphingobium resinovorum]
MEVSTQPVPAPRISLPALFLKFLRFGCLAFGGPVAQIAMLRQSLVEEEGWVDHARFNRLLAVLQILPGPEAHELCVHLGVMARGRVGGLLAGLGFMLPGLFLMLLAAWIYVTLIAGHLGWSTALLGIQIVVLAVILRAVFRIGEHILDDRFCWAIAIGSAAATLAGMPFWLPLAGGALIHAFAHRTGVLACIVFLALLLAVWIHHLPIAEIVAVPGAANVTSAALFIAGLKGGLLTFGGAYTAIPYVRADTVGRGWLSDATFLDGIALAGVLPAPLVIFATFAGYVAGGLAGALAITAGMFLPAFAFSMIFYERLEAAIEHPALQRALSGVAASVVGIIGATFVQLSLATAHRLTAPLVAIVLFAAALLIVWRVKGMWVTPAVLAAGAFAGVVLRL